MYFNTNLGSTLTGARPIALHLKLVHWSLTHANRSRIPSHCRSSDTWFTAWTGTPMDLANPWKSRNEASVTLKECTNMTARVVRYL